MTNEIVISNRKLERSEADFLPSIKRTAEGDSAGRFSKQTFQIARMLTTFSFYPFKTRPSLLDGIGKILASGRSK